MLARQTWMLASRTIRGLSPVAIGLWLLGCHDPALPYAGLPPTCLDGAREPDESDVDCGGPACGRCEDGRSCRLGGDCASGFCYQLRCRTPTCTDSIVDGDETDVDCGGK